jgi:hypothetical protein
MITAIEGAAVGERCAGVGAEVDTAPIMPLMLAGHTSALQAGARHVDWRRI